MTSKSEKQINVPIKNKYFFAFSMFSFLIADAQADKPSFELAN